MPSVSSSNNKVKPRLLIDTNANKSIYVPQSSKSTNFNNFTKIFPDAVTKGDDGFLRIRMEDMFYALINAVKELDTKIETLKNNEIATLKKQVQALEKENKALEKQLEALEKKLK